MRFFLPRFLYATSLVSWAFCSTGREASSGCDTVYAAINGFDPVRLHAALSAFQTYSVNLHGLVIERHRGVVAECYRAGKDRSAYSLLNHTLEAFGPRTSGSQIKNPAAAATGQIRPKWIICVENEELSFCC